MFTQGVRWGFKHTYYTQKYYFQQRIPRSLLCFTVGGTHCGFKHSPSGRQRNWRRLFPDRCTLYSFLINIRPHSLPPNYHMPWTLKSFLTVFIVEKGSNCCFMAHELCVFHVSPYRKETRMPLSVFINTCTDVVGHFKSMMFAENFYQPVLSAEHFLGSMLTWALHKTISLRYTRAL